MHFLINTPLATLPRGLLRKITSYLDLQEYVNLRATCTRLCRCLKSDKFCRAYVEVFAKIVDLLQILGLIGVGLHELYIRSRSRTEIVD